MTKTVLNFENWNLVPGAFILSTARGRIPENSSSWTHCRLSVRRESRRNHTSCR